MLLCPALIIESLLLQPIRSAKSYLASSALCDMHLALAGVILVVTHGLQKSIIHSVLSCDECMGKTQALERRAVCFTTGVKIGTEAFEIQS